MANVTYSSVGSQPANAAGTTSSAAGATSSTSAAASATRTSWDGAANFAPQSRGGQGQSAVDAQGPTGQTSAALQDDANASMHVGAQTKSAEVENFLQRVGMPALVTANGGTNYIVTGLSRDAQGETIAHSVDPNSSSGTGSDVPLRTLSNYINTVARLQPNPSAAPMQTVQNGPKSSVGAGQYTITGLTTDAHSGGLNFTLHNQATGATTTAGLDDVINAFSIPTVQASIQRMLPHVVVASQALGAAASDQSTGGGAATNGAEATTRFTGQSPSETTAAWAAARGDTPFLAQRSQDGSWALVTRQGDGSYASSNLDGSAAPASEAHMAGGALGEHFATGQDVAPVVGTYLRDPSGAAGRSYSVSGLGRDADGKPTVTVTPWQGGRQGSASGPAESLSLQGFNQRFGAAGRDGLLAGAQSTPTLDAGTGANSWIAGTGADGTGNIYGNGGAGAIHQGQTGDCYFDAALAGLMQQDPQALQKLIKPAASGNPYQYDVTLYAASANGSYQPHTVTVDDRIPVDPTHLGSGGLAADFSGSGARIDNAGPALVEKAYAILNQRVGTGGPRSGVRGTQPVGYAGIAGGSGLQSLATLTGSATSQWYWRNGREFSEDAWQAASQANHGVPVTAGSRSDSPVPAAGPGVVTGHEYTVLGTSEVNGQRQITLRNPWGSPDSAPRGSQQSDGTPKPQKDTITLSADDFMRYFWQVSSTVHA